MRPFQKNPSSLRWRIALALIMFLLTPPLLVPEQDDAPAKPSSGKPVEVQMHNVMYHFQDNVAVHIRRLGGELISAANAQFPVFDDKNSFTLHIVAAEMAITVQSMANVLNQYAFVRNDAPIKDVSMRIEKG